MTKQDYYPSSIERKWQKIWGQKGIYSPNLDKAKKPFYNLMMFPYPSAEGMHVGNMYAFTGADVYGRFMRMQGFDVFEPIGLDGFGIHSENYAIKVGRHPKEQAKISEANFYRQLRATGNGFDWSRKVETYDPSYYKWTQWLFIQLFKAGLAYRAKAKVNWCPSCKTVLADEQVITKSKESKMLKQVQHDKGGEAIGVCERCETPVEKKDLEQWFFRITKYAERLLANLEKLDWSEKVKIAQRQWIGRSEGAKISFVIPNLFRDLGFSGSKMLKQVQHDTKKIEVFTTRPDTLYGATFLVLSPEHPTIGVILNSFQNLGSNEIPKSIRQAQDPEYIEGQVRDDIKEYVEQAKKKTEQERMAEGKEKTGVFSGLYAVNPLNNEKIPIWIADYVLIEYGTGAIMGVPAHDQRDYEFAKKYNLPIKSVIRGSEATPESLRALHDRGDSGQARMTKGGDRVLAYTGDGVIVNSGEWNGWRVPEEIGKVIDWLEKKGMGNREITYHLRDWLISRQRYWGPPIPMIYCEACAKKGISYNSVIPTKRERVEGSNITGSVEEDSSTQEGFARNDKVGMAGWYPVHEKDLPVLLPDIKDWKPKGTGKSPLATVESFVNTECPNCGGAAKRETDVSDNFLDSSWYFLRYLATEFDTVPFPVSSNVILNLFQDLGYSGKKMLKQVQHDIGKRRRWLPVSMYIGGAEHSVLHLLYSRFITMVLKDLGFIEFEEPFSRFYAHGLLVKEGAKMSKSKGNVVVPDEYIAKFGADTLRMYLMFLGPFSQGGDFYDSGIEGMFRFLKRVWTLVHDKKDSMENKNDSGKSLFGSNEAYVFMNKTIKRVKDDMENLRYNTAIAALMEYYNFLSKQEYIAIEEFRNLLKLLSPFAPHTAEELWEYIGGKFSIHQEIFPKFNQNALKSFHRTIVIQINGKLRDTIIVTDQASKNKNIIEQLAKESDRVKKHLEGKVIKKVVYVEGKIINFVTDDR